MNSEYIKMVLALPDEFFEGWEWRHCDYAINLDNIEKGRATPLEEQFHTEFKILYVDSCFKDTEWVFKDRVRPIPSQEQLQEKILDYWKKNIYSGYTYVELLSQFRIFIFQRCDIKKLRDNKSTVNEMWLMFLEDEIYHKMWNGDAWI